VALALAARRLAQAEKIAADPMRLAVAAISTGIIDGEARVDLPYVEDSKAEVDCNFVMTGDGRFVEVQATAEKDAFSAEQYAALVALASTAMQTLFSCQRDALERARR
jgi:ribonuclease PH